MKAHRRWLACSAFIAGLLLGLATSYVSVLLRPDTRAEESDE